MDVKLAFLIDKLEEEVYVEQSKGYMIKREKEKVYKLKQGLIQIEIKMNIYFIKIEFQICPYQHTLYVKSYL